MQAGELKVTALAKKETMIIYTAYVKYKGQKKKVALTTMNQVKALNKISALQDLDSVEDVWMEY
jgi:hypothetical protein